jgi:mycothiol synthase
MVKIRNYRESDFTALNTLYAGAEENSLWEALGCARQLDMILRRPHYRPESDLFVAETEGHTVGGYADVIREVRIGRVVMDVYVAPRLRRQGIGSRLVEKVVNRSASLGAGVVHTYIDQNRRGSRTFLKRAGFKSVRRYLVLERPADAGPEGERDFGELRLKAFQAGEEARLAEIQNESFSGSWGFCPNSPDEIRFFLELMQTRIEEVLVLWDGNEAVGYLWPQVVDRRGHQAGKHGWIHMVGIRPDFRGRGWGKSLIEAGLWNFRERGVESVELTVDEKNRAAVNLYSALGFRTKSRKLWYEYILP